MFLPFSSLTRSPRLQHKRWAGLLRLAAFIFIAATLAVSLKQDGFPLGAFEAAFLSLLLLTLALEFYWLEAPAISTGWARLRNLKTDRQEGLFTPLTSLYRHRRGLRVFLHFTMIAANLAECIRVAGRDSRAAGLLAVGFFIYSIIFLEWACSESIRHFGWGPAWLLWSLVGLGMGASVGKAAYEMKADPVLSIFIGGFGTLVALVIYLNERMNITEHVWSLVVQELIVEVLDTHSATHNLRRVAGQIASRLGYEHVVLLRASEDGGQLTIAAEAGNWPDLKSRPIPVTQGITGRAFSTGLSSAWNDVTLCPYFVSLDDERSDPTRAEIAVPIKHRGQTFGVLDVQSRSALVFGPEDLRTLVVIAHILGAAWAAQRSDALISQGASLWERLSGEMHSESDVLEVFTAFARQELGADLVVYYRLSPTGFPIHLPQIIGELHSESHVQTPFTNMDSPFFEAIRQWKPAFQEDVHDSIFYKEQSPGDPGFARREGVKSLCFIPVGTREDRMAAVFLNYRRVQRFDGLFQLMVLGFAQAFATTLSREWNSDLLFHGLGRPELGVHNILGRYGLKDGVLQEGSDAFRRAGGDLNAKVYPELRELLQLVDNCLMEIRAQATKVSMNWEESLHERIDDLTRQIKDNVPGGRPVRFVKELDPLVERESPWTRLALYRVVEEAVGNAIFHGQATEIAITLSRSEHVITLSVVNDGLPLPVDIDRRHSRSGIFRILSDLEAQFHAQTSIRSRGTETEGSTDGTVVTVQIPALPISKERRL